MRYRYWLTLAGEQCQESWHPRGQAWLDVWCVWRGWGRHSGRGRDHQHRCGPLQVSHVLLLLLAVTDDWTLLVSDWPALRRTRISWLPACLMWSRRWMRRGMGTSPKMNLSRTLWSASLSSTCSSPKELETTIHIGQDHHNVSDLLRYAFT